MNNDLISREVLKKRLQENHDFFLKAWDNSMVNMPKEDKARLDEISNCIAEVVNAPTVVNEKLTSERQQGEWVGIEEYDDYPYKTVCECSECGKIICVSHYEFPNFCENCGADMRGEEG